MKIHLLNLFYNWLTIFFIINSPSSESMWTVTRLRTSAALPASVTPHPETSAAVPAGNSESASGSVTPATALKYGIAWYNHFSIKPDLHYLGVEE